MGGRNVSPPSKSRLVSTLGAEMKCGSSGIPAAVVVVGQGSDLSFIVGEGSELSFRIKGVFVECKRVSSWCGEWQESSVGLVHVRP